MRITDLFIFGPPILIGIGGWLAGQVAIKAIRRQKALTRVRTVAE